MAIRVGINGFGRIGRNFSSSQALRCKNRIRSRKRPRLFRNACASAKNDSVHGKFGGSVKAVRGELALTDRNSLCSLNATL